MCSEPMRHGVVAEQVVGAGVRDQLTEPDEKADDQDPGHADSDGDTTRMRGRPLVFATRGSGGHGRVCPCVPGFTPGDGTEVCDPPRVTMAR